MVAAPGGRPRSAPGARPPQQRGVPETASATSSTAAQPESKVLSGRERLADVEYMEDLVYNSRRELQILEATCHATHAEVCALEETEYRKDMQLVDMLLTAKVTPPYTKEIESIRSELELLAEAKKKTSELRERVEERERAILSIAKQLKQSRAAQLEDEVAKLQELVKATKIQYEQFCDDSHLARTRQMHASIHRSWAETHRLQTQLSAFFSKQAKLGETFLAFSLVQCVTFHYFKPMQETQDIKQMQMTENEKQTAVLNSKMDEILEKERIGEQRLEEQLGGVEERLDAMKERAAQRMELLQQRRELERLEAKKLEKPPRRDRDHFFVSSKVLHPSTALQGIGSSSSSSSSSSSREEMLRPRLHPELRIGLQAMRNSPACLGALFAAAKDGQVSEGSFVRIAELALGLATVKQLPGERVLKLLRKAAPHLFESGEGGTLRLLDFTVCLSSYQEEIVQIDALREATRALRRKCIEKRVSEKAAKEVFFRSGATGIGSFLLKIDLEPIYIDHILHVIKSVGGAAQQHNLGAAKICCSLDPWQATTVQDDVQLCDFFFSNQKRSITAHGQDDFERKIDRRETYRQHELEHLFWLFSDEQERVVIKMPMTNVTPTLLSQLTHGKLPATRS
ncbi:unnamed protein product [Amoebophrya sp. A25]|nr:unnamed protein product [Amoebophrya sp. A25]|eukprot:GSA25T00015730001.1